MAVIISNTFFYSPPLRTLKFHNQYYNNNTHSSHNNTSRYIKLFTFTTRNSNNSNDYDSSSEESRWRREEQRWLREEQRWLREESRWNNEKNSLLLQIQHLQSQIDRFRTRNDVDFDFDVDSASKMLVKFAAMMKGLRSDNDSMRITDFIDKEVQFEVQVDVSPEGETIDKETETETEKTRLSSGLKVGDEEKEKEKVKEKTVTKVKATSSLRMGAEGEEVRLLQEALMSLGFYSGEEEMEFSSFSEGTASAVKTWQASIGIREDGIMTPALLERLYASQEVQSSESNVEADILKIEEEEKEKTKLRVKATSSLRMGAEGEEVRILQEALMSLGFYSGEEDMEFSSFSDGTARAVKTWQASIGIHEDGIMTPELLERLYASQEDKSYESSLETVIRKIDGANGAVAKVKEVQQTVVEKTQVDVSHPRVFLLGENRWEEPSRLNKTKSNIQVSAQRCLTCKGEGRLLCMECDGTGEPNVEEQFLDWVDEEPKCPYCDGLGYNVCDVCDGKPVI